MRKVTFFCLFFLIAAAGHLHSQPKSDLAKDNLRGKVKSIKASEALEIGSYATGNNEWFTKKIKSTSE